MEMFGPAPGANCGLVSQISAALPWGPVLAVTQPLSIQSSLRGAEGKANTWPAQMIARTLAEAPMVEAAVLLGGTVAVRVIVRRRFRDRGQRRSTSFCCRGSRESGSAGGQPTPTPLQFRQDLFLRLPLNNGVLLPSPFTEEPEFPLLPPAQTLPLAIIPATEGETQCVPFDDSASSSVAAALKQRLAPGPLRPLTGPGRALQQTLRNAPEHFQSLRDYELRRTALGGRCRPAEKAEVLLLDAYERLMKHAGAPSRPAALTGRGGTDFDAYAKHFGGAAMRALESCTSPDFQLVAKAHVLGLLKDASFPQLKRSEARTLYANAMRFGHAVRQAEIRFLADGAAGTFVPLPLEAQLVREELEEMWLLSLPVKKKADPSNLTEKQAGVALREAAPSNFAPVEDDAEAAQRSLNEVLARLCRIGEARPALATYLGWLGRFDPEALAMLADPASSVALAMQMQVTAVWGPQPGAGTPDEIVATTPSDMLEALLFGVLLRDAWIEADELLDQHRHAREDAGE